MTRAFLPRAPLARRSIVSIALLLIGLLVLELWGWPFLRAPAEAMLTRQLDRPVLLTPPFRLHLLGAVRIHAGGVWIAAPTGFDAPHVLDAKDLRLRMRYRDLLTLRESGDLRIALLVVEHLDAHLLRRDDGTATWQIGKPREAATERDEAPRPPPEVDRLAVGEGRLELRDALLATDLRATFATDEGGADKAPRSSVEVRGQFHDRPLEGELETEGFLRLFARGEGLRPVPATGRLEYGGVKAEFNGTVTDLFGSRDIRGSAAASGPSLAVLGELFGMVLPTTAPFSLRGEVWKDGDLWRAAVSEARFGSSKLAGRFAYEADAEPPRLEGTLTGSRFVLADLGPAFGTRDEDGTPVEPPPGRILPDRRLDLPSLRNMDAQIAVNLEHVDLGTAFAEPIAPLKADLGMSAGRLTLAGIDARTARGSLSGDISVDSREQIPLWRSDLRWSEIRVEDWIGIAKTGASKAQAEGEPPPPPYFAGELHGRAQLVGRGHSTAELLGSLDGKITLFLRDGSMSHLVVELLGLDVAQSLGVVFAGDRSLPTECALMHLAAAKGRLMPRVGIIDTPVTSVLVDGSVDLGSETLALRFIARPKNVSPFTARAPIRVHGSFIDPSVSPEPGPIARRALGALVLSFINPLAALIPFIDLGEEAESPCARALDKLRS